VSGDVLRVRPDPLVVRRQNALYDAWSDAMAAHAGEPDYDPDDDPEFIDRAQAITEGGPVVDKSARAELTGHDQLHHYWTRGEGLAKWADHPHPWTALYHHLLKYLPDGEAKRTAANWFHDVFHMWPGERKGKNPAGPG
jgi:hypothetical protein